MHAHYKLLSYRLAANKCARVLGAGEGTVLGPITIPPLGHIMLFLSFHTAPQHICTINSLQITQRLSQTQRHLKQKVKHMKEENIECITKQQADYSHPWPLMGRPPPTGAGGNLVNNAAPL